MESGGDLGDRGRRGQAQARAGERELAQHAERHDMGACWRQGAHDMTWARPGRAPAWQGVARGLLGREEREKGQGEWTKPKGEPGRGMGQAQGEFELKF